MEQQFDSEMEALRGAVNRQATNQGGMRMAQRAELQQLTNLRQAEVLQQRKQHLFIYDILLIARTFRINTR